MANFFITSTSGTVDYGLQVIDFGTDIFISQPSPAVLLPRRVGYAWFLVKENADVENQFLIARFPMYTPGVSAPLESRWEPIGYLGRLVIEWDFPGLEFEVFY